MKIPFFVSVPILASLAHGADLYVADFSTAGVGATHDTTGDTLEASPVDGENWSIFWTVDPNSDTSTNSFITEDGFLISEDWGGEGFFETDDIDVSAESTIKIVAEAATRGVDVFNNAGTEQFLWYYTLDGVRTDGPLFTGDGSLNFDEELDVSAASTLVVGFTFNVNGAGDGFEVSSLEVNDGVPTPEISLDLDPANVAENGGTSTVTVNVTVAPAGSLVLDLAVDDATEASVPATVTIPSGQTSASFQLTGVDDVLSDGPQFVVLSVTDPSAVYEAASALVVVSDNEAFSPPSVFLNEIRINSNTVGDGEYFELTSTQANASLDRLFLVAIGDGAANQGSGVVEEIIDLTGQTMNGNFFLAVDPEQDFATNEDLSVALNFEDDNVTFLLVSDFAAVLGTDLDADDDGTLDSAPWGSLLDAVSLVSTEFPTALDDLVYAGSLTPARQEVGPDGNFIPGHVYRSSTNFSTWLIGTFFADSVDVADTPGAANSGGGGVVDSELQIISFSVDEANNEAVLTVAGLGDSVYELQSSDDLGQLDAWTAVTSGFVETDNADGSTNLTFSNSFSSAPKRFFRLVEQP